MQEKWKVLVVTQPVLPVCCCHFEGKKEAFSREFPDFSFMHFLLYDIIGTHKSRSACSFKHVECDGNFIVPLPSLVLGVGL
jgi:hypothetical protein